MAGRGARLRFVASDWLVVFLHGRRLIACLPLAPGASRRDTAHTEVPSPRAWPTAHYLHSSFFILHFALCNLHFALCTLQFAICNLQFAICNLPSLIRPESSSRIRAIGVTALRHLLFNGKPKSTAAPAAVGAGEAVSRQAKGAAGRLRPKTNHFLALRRPRETTEKVGRPGGLSSALPTFRCLVRTPTCHLLRARLPTTDLLDVGWGENSWPEKAHANHLPWVRGGLTQSQSRHAMVSHTSFFSLRF
jgi:hypothetical protein